MLGAAILASIVSPVPVKNNSNIITKFENSEVNEGADLAEDFDQDSELPTVPEEPAEIYQYKSDLIFKALNPGYTVDGTRDVGEFIELQKISDITSLSLAGYAIWYVNSSGNDTLLIDFAEGSSLAGETLLVRLARSPDSDRADATYMTTLAMGSGKLDLRYNGESVDTVCWGSKECLAAFKSAKPTSLVRDLTSNEFIHLEDYIPFYDPDQPSLILPAEPETPEEPDVPDQPSQDITTNTCIGLEFSEIYSYYTSSNTEQFIELYNSTDHELSLTDCALRYKNKVYPLTGQIMASGYYSFYPSKDGDFSLTKNPASSNIIELVNNKGETVDVLTYQHGQKKSASFAKFYDGMGEENWQITYNVTPNSENIYQEFRSCTEGKVINLDTGNCVKATTITSTSKECAEGQYRNPLTGRCKKIETETEAKPCAAGYERNPSTGRCRKVVSPNDGADYALVPETYSSKSTFTALGIVLLIVALGIIYIILQFRREILRAMRKTRQRLHHVREDLVARSRGIHRDKKT